MCLSFLLLGWSAFVNVHQSSTYKNSDYYVVNYLCAFCSNIYALCAPMMLSCNRSLFALICIQSDNVAAIFVITFFMI